MFKWSQWSTETTRSHRPTLLAVDLNCESPFYAQGLSSKPIIFDSQRSYFGQDVFHCSRGRLQGRYLFVQSPTRAARPLLLFGTYRHH